MTKAVASSSRQLTTSRVDNLPPKGQVRGRTHSRAPAPPTLVDKEIHHLRLEVEKEGGRNDSFYLPLPTGYGRGLG